MPQSPELAGGAGFTFEDSVAATYLAALLQEGFAPGVADRTVSRVALQQRDFGEPLDDVIVDFRDAHGEPGRLSLQIKTALTISAAPSNTTFREVVRDCWLTFRKPDFRAGVDRYGAAVGTLASDKARDLATVCDLARSSPTVEDFDARFAPGGNAGASAGRIKEDLSALITAAKGAECSHQELKDFLVHLVLLRFDRLHEVQADLAPILNSLRSCLATVEAAQASALWDRLCRLARDGAGRSAVFNRPSIVRSLAANFRLAASPSFRHDLEHLRRLARQWLADIENDVGGTRLERPGITADLESKLASSRWVHIRGLPGSGKSALLRRRVDGELTRGPVLFIKAGRLEGTGWASFASANGLSNASLPDLLVELGATGSSVLYIDGIDRIEKSNRPVVLDLVRTIMDDPLLDNWRIVVSLRDTGIEPLRNWLGNVLGKTGIGTVEVTGLDDAEAKALATAKPHLGPLLFGAKQVREIVRRPFFAKVLNDSFGSSTSDAAFQPQDEIDLIRNWWARGGYNSEGQAAFDRQRALVELGSVRGRHLEREIAVPDLSASTRDFVDRFVADGILQHVRLGHSLRFAHDIFFEWAFLHVLTDAEDWLAELAVCGEPPALARAVELLSQAEFRNGDAWLKGLHRVAGSLMRSQWTRAWLLAPLATPSFEVSGAHFAAVVQADDHRFLKKALVWFQAERTTPSPIVMERDLPRDERVRLADLLGWPSDGEMWSRFIRLLLTHIATIPVALRPEVLSIFEVWQNALGNYRNPTSDALLQQTSIWLVELTQDPRSRRSPSPPSAWGTLGSELEGFTDSLSQLILRSAPSRPDLAEDYLRQLLLSDDLNEERLRGVVAFSPILSRTHPDLLVELVTKGLCEELPQQRLARERSERDRSVRLRDLARAKRPEERTRADELAAQGHFMSLGIESFGHFDWERLSIDDDRGAYFPPSALREPFHSLFANAPERALRLLVRLSSHAMVAWLQLHELAHDTPGTPVPLEIHFPWGSQRFWGGDREYLWCRGTWAPQPIRCGYLALEEWSLGELERGRPVDELIEQIVAGNECIAALGAATTVAIQAQKVSEGVYSLVTSQRLLDADHSRWMQDYSGSRASLIGFNGRNDVSHIDSIKGANARPVRQAELRQLIPLFVFNPTFRERIQRAVRQFTAEPPFQLEHHRSDPMAQEHLRGLALEHAELVEMSHYRLVSSPTGGEAVVHVSPTAASPERVARAQEASIRLQEGNLWAWAEKYFETGRLTDGFTVQSALACARSADGVELFEASSDALEMIDMRRGAIAATAAVSLGRREGVSEDDLAWARDALKRAMNAREKRDMFWSPQSVISWHPCIGAVRGVAADIGHGTADRDAASAVLTLVAHPLEVVSFAALDAALSLWSHDPRLAWCALHLALTLCIVPPEGRPRRPGDAVHSEERVRAAIDEAVDSYNEPGDWPTLPVPPAPWLRKNQEGRTLEADTQVDELTNDASAAESWAPSPVQWYDRNAAQVISRIPLESILKGTARTKLLDFLAAQLAWTIAKKGTPGDARRRRQRSDAQLFEWMDALGGMLGRVCGLCALPEVEGRFLMPILTQEDDICWELLAPLVDVYICVHIYDAPQMPPDATTLLSRCLDRFLRSAIFDAKAYRAGELHGFVQPRLTKALMFVAIDDLARGAVRYANGDWSELERVLPIIDRFVRAAGWSSTIAAHFLTLCERARDAYPATEFAEQVLAVLDGSGSPLKGWHGTILPARIAGLVQHFADREHSMPQALAQRLLRILDLLVDMGDRRSAALQLSESFREVQSSTH